MRLKTWHFEHAVVVSVLLGVWLTTGAEARELVGSIAVYLAFGHASVSERMREREAARPVPSVECHRTATWYFLGKELCWAAYFIWSGSYAALVGCAVFAAYPLWRRYWRRIRPLQAIPAPPADLSALPIDALLREVREREIGNPGGPELLSRDVRRVYRAGGVWPPTSNERT